MKHGKLIGVDLSVPRSLMTDAQLTAVRAYDREYRAKWRKTPHNKKRDSEAYKRCIDKDREKVNRRNLDWRKKNWGSVYQKRKENKLVLNLRARFAKSLKQQSVIRSQRLLNLLGCTLPELRSHLEAKFTDGMTWENYGPVWHVDHIKPCAAFDLSSPEEMAKCFHFSNLQPLLARDNLCKSAHFP